MVKSGAIVAFQPDPGSGAYDSPVKPVKRVSIDDGKADFADDVRVAAGETRSEKRDRVRKENLGLCGQICIFVVFLAIFTGTVLLERSSSAPQLAAHIRGMLEDGHVPLSSISDGDSLFRYLREAFVPALYENNVDTRMARALSSSLHPIDVSNRLLGGVRLRQVRVGLQTDCQMGPMFVQYTISCYPPFSPDVESRSAFGPGGRFSYSEDAEGTSWSGVLGSYTPNGFMELLPTNRTSALATILQMEADKFIDDATRAVFVDFSVWNGNVGMYAVVGILIEFGASGGCKYAVDVTTMTEANLSAGGLGFTANWLGFLGNVLLILFVVWYLAEELQEFCRDQFQYLGDWFWNSMDWVNMALIVAAFALRIMSFSQASSMNIGAQEILDPDSFTNFRALAEKVERARQINALNAVFMWCKMLKYYRFMPMLKELITVIWRALLLFVPYMVMFTVAFIGFSMSYNIGFGDKIYELSTFGSTVIYLCRAFIRDIELMPAYDITPAFGALLILLFYVAMVLVGTIVMFAILATAQFEAKYDKSGAQSERDNLHEDEPIEEFTRYVKAKLRRFMRKKFPWIYVKVYGKGKKLDPNSRDSSATLATSGGSSLALPAPSNAAPRAVAGAWRRALDDGASERSSYMDGESDLAPPSREGLMRAIEHMSGRVLSEISILGIEIKSELHDVCERVHQMKVAAEELSWRADQIHLEQSEEL